MNAHGDFRFKEMLVFQMGTQRHDVVILVAVRAWEVLPDLPFHLKIIKPKSIYKRGKKNIDEKRFVFSFPEHEQKPDQRRDFYEKSQIKT